MCGPRASEHAARVEDADRLTPSHSLRSGTPTRRRHPSGRSRSSAGCRRRDAVAKRGSGRSGHGRPAEPRRQGCGGRGRPRWWRGAGSFAVTPTSGDRYGWSGVESWRDGAPTDSQQLSQDYSQQCSQTSSRDGGRVLRLGNSQQHSQQHSQDSHSNTHRPRSQPCEWSGSVRASRLMIGLSGRPGVGKGTSSGSSCSQPGTVFMRSSDESGLPRPSASSHHRKSCKFLRFDSSQDYSQQHSQIQVTAL